MLKYYLLIYIIITVPTASSQDDEHLYICRQMAERLPHIAAVPSQQILMYGETFTATRHHIIPYDTLADFYNLVVREDPARSTYGNVLRRRISLILAFFENFPNSGEFLRRHPRLGGLEAEIRLVAAYTWMPGNLFYGPPPHRRYNDPNNGFEVRAERITGSEAFARLRRLYTNMRNYIDDENYRTVDNFHNLTNEIYEVAVSRNRPYEFNENDWIPLNYVGNVRPPLFDIRNVTTPHIEEELRRKKKRFIEDNHVDITGDRRFIYEEYLLSARAVCEELVKTGYFRNTTSDYCLKKGYKLEPRTGSCYNFHQAAQTWRQALSSCHAEGGHLAIINSQTESTVLKELYEEYPKEMITGATERRHAFIGFQEYRDGEWATIYGDTLSEAGFAVWDEREPSSWQGNEFCGSVHVNGFLNNAPCEDKSPFICEITGGMPLSAISLSWAAFEPYSGNAVECSTQCNGYKLETRTGSYYKFHQAAQTWRQALSSCHAEGGHLAIINSQTESTVLKELYEKYPKDMITGATDRNHAFIGFQEYRDGEWATIYGDTLVEAGFTVWDKGEPSSWQGNEFCGSVHVNGLLNNAPCEGKSPFICEITGGMPLSAISLSSAAFEPYSGNAVECSTKCNGYKLEPRTGSYYKFHQAAQTWRQALSTCHAEGGHLAIINSQTESTVLKELYEKYPKDMITGATDRNHAFIGFQEYRDGEWATIYGDTLAEAGFTGWDHREPSSWQGNEFCGSVHVNGLLNNAPCKDKSPFICEITPIYTENRN